MDLVQSQDDEGRALIHAISEANDVAYLQLLLDHKAAHAARKFDVNGAGSRLFASDRLRVWVRDGVPGRG